jgi:uncharacterized protein Yka (UPF0111/DUF47 family)
LAKKEIIQLEQRIDEIRFAIGLQSPKMDDMPHYSSTISIVEQTVCVLVDLCAKLEAKKFRLAKELEELEYFLDSIENSLARQILRLRYEESKKWAEVARLVGGNNTDESVKKFVIEC